MSVNRNENRQKWGIALVVAIVLFCGSLFMTAISMSIADWLPFYFCWGDMLLVGAIFIILLNLVAGDSLPDTTGWGESAAGGFLLAITAFTLFALNPSRYSDPTGQMMELGCFGVLGALIAFALGAGFRRYSILLVAGSSFFFWNIYIPYEVVSLSLTVVCLGVAGAFLYWLNRAYPLVKTEPEFLEIEDILSDPELIKAAKDGKGWSTEMADPDVAMSLLERLAQEQSNSAKEDDVPDWLTAPDELSKEKISTEPFQEESVLDKSSPALLAIFVVLLIGVLFFLTFVAVFMR